MELLLFGDQATNVHSFLHPLLFQRGHTTLLASFLSRVTATLRKDIADLPHLKRKDIPPLNELLQFLNDYHRSPCPNAPVANALLCISQLAHFIRSVFFE